MYKAYSLSLMSRVFWVKLKEKHMKIYTRNKQYDHTIDYKICEISLS